MNKESNKIIIQIKFNEKILPTINSNTSKLTEWIE